MKEQDGARTDPDPIKGLRIKKEEAVLEIFLYTYIYRFI